MPLVPDSFVVNAGNLIQFWTNGLWRSNLHRVVNPSPCEAELSRLSIIFFTGPNQDAVVEPLEKCVQHTGEKPLYEPVVVKEYLAGKRKTTFVQRRTNKLTYQSQMNRMNYANYIGIPTGPLS